MEPYVEMRIYIILYTLIAIVFFYTFHAELLLQDKKERIKKTAYHPALLFTFGFISAVLYTIGSPKFFVVVANIFFAAFFATFLAILYVWGRVSIIKSEFWPKKKDVPEKKEIKIVSRIKNWILNIAAIPKPKKEGKLKFRAKIKIILLDQYYATTWIFVGLFVTCFLIWKTLQNFKGIIRYIIFSILILVTCILLIWLKIVFFLAKVKRQNRSKKQR